MAFIYYVTQIQLDFGAVKLLNEEANKALADPAVRERFAGATNTPLAPDRDADFSFAFGYGFGYGFSNAFSVEIVRDLTMTLHQKTGLAPSDDSMHRINSTRLVGRLGFGG